MSVDAEHTHDAPTPDAAFWVSRYVDWVLTHGHEPTSVYTWARSEGYEESAFYDCFGSIEGLRRSIWKQWMDNAIQLLEQQPHFERMSGRDKTLTLFYTLIEILTLNRSYALHVLQQKPLAQMADMADFRQTFKRLVASWAPEIPQVAPKAMQRIVEPAQQEALWGIWLLVLAFWKDDASARFEKTDAFIEKTISTAFTLAQTAPLQQLFDWGKFVYNERLSRA